MADLRTQLRAYVEATIERVDVADALAVRAVAPERRWYQRPVAVALGAAAAMLILVGGVTFLTRWLTQGGPATTTTVVTTTTTLAPTTTTTVPPTTTTTVPVLNPADAAAWAAVTPVLPEEGIPPFLGGGHVVNDLAGGESLIVAVGDATNSDENAMRSGLVWISADGRSWERVDDPDDLEYGGKGLNAVVAGGPGFVMAGTSCDFEERCTAGWRAAIWTSVDGRDWLRVPHDPEVFGDRSGISDLLVRQGEILALGAICPDDSCSWAVWASNDGFSWERVWMNATAWPNAFAETGAGLVAVGSEDLETGESVAAVWTSLDGREWQRVTHDPEVFGDGRGVSWAMLDVAGGANGFAAVGLDGTNAVVWVSSDGTTWERLPADPEVFGGSSMTTVISWGSGYLAAGPDWAITPELGGPVPGYPSAPSRPTLWWSPEGRTWFRIPFGAEDAVGAVRSLLGFNGALIAAGQNGPFVTPEGEPGEDAIWVNEEPPRTGG
jgi:hypothetical protein